MAPRYATTHTKALLTGVDRRTIKQKSIVEYFIELSMPRDGIDTQRINYLSALL